MAIDLNINDQLRVDRVQSNSFIEDVLTITGAGAISVEQGVGSALFTVSGSTTPLSIEQDDVSVGNFGTINFDRYLTATDDGGTADISVSGLVTTDTVQTIDADKTFGGNVIIEGNLTVTGTTQTVISETVLIEDNIFALNSNHTGAATQDAGFYVERGDDTDVILFWDESSDHWAIGLTDDGGTPSGVDNLVYASELSTVSGDLVSYVNSVSGDLSAEIDSDILALSGAADAKYVDVAGDTMTGDLTLPGIFATSGTLANVGAGATSLVNRSFVENAVANAVLTVQQDDVVVSDDVGQIDFGAEFFSVVSGTGEVVVTLTGVASSDDLTTYSGYAEGQFIDTTEIVTISGDAVTTANNYTDGEITALSGYAEGAFVNVSGDTMTGFLTLHADPTASGHAATKQYVDDQVASATIFVENDNVQIHDSVNTFDFGEGIAATSGTGNEVTIALSGVVLTTTAQSIAGDKTFTGSTVMDGSLTANAGFITASGAQPASASDTATEGEVRWADDYLYIAVGTDTWKRVPLSTWV